MLYQQLGRSDPEVNDRVHRRKDRLTDIFAMTRKKLLRRNAVRHIYRDIEYSCNKYNNLIGQLEVHYFIYGPRGLISRSNIGVLAIF